MIEKLKQPDDFLYEWIDENGCSHDSKKEYLQQEILGFCGCGNPDDVMAYVGDFLEKLDKSEFGDYEDMAYMFLVYWANDKEFAAHGTTARCSWLTDKGKELLSDIKWCLENEKDK